MEESPSAVSDSEAQSPYQTGRCDTVLVATRIGAEIL